MLYAVRRWRVILGTILVLCLLFILLHAFHNPSGLTLNSLAHSTQVALGFLMAMESPETAMAGFSWPMLLFAWFVCISGWLLLPLLVGAMLDVLLESIQSESKCRFMFEQVGLSRNLSGKQLDEFVKKMMIKKDELLSGKQ